MLQNLESEETQLKDEIEQINEEKEKDEKEFKVRISPLRNKNPMLDESLVMTAQSPNRDVLTSATKKPDEIETPLQNQTQIDTPM